MAHLTANVIVRDPYGTAVVIEAGAELPEWAPAYLRESAVEDPAPAAPERKAASAGAVGPPPRKGPGSGQPAWLAYARVHGVQVSDDDKREDIIAACAAADVPAE